MADERLKRLAFSWGLVGFGMQAGYLFYVFLDQGVGDLRAFLQEENLDAVTLRFGQLKPPMFKFPDCGWMVWLYVIALVLCVTAIWWKGLKDLFRTPDE